MKYVESITFENGLTVKKGDLVYVKTIKEYFRGRVNDIDLKPQFTSPYIEFDCSEKYKKDVKRIFFGDIKIIQLIEENK